MPQVPFDYAAAPQPMAQDTPQPVGPDPTLGQTIAADFRQLNDVVSVGNYIGRDIFRPDPNFDVGAAVQDSPYFNDHLDRLIRAQSAPELQQIEQRITQEYKDKATIARSGKTGMAIGVLASVLSPTMFIPFLGEARGAKGAVTAYALAAGAMTAQESALFLTQETKTTKDTMMNIAAGTILAGTLGAAVSFLRPAAKASLIKDLNSTGAVVPPPDKLLISPRAKEVGAAVPDTPVDPGDFAGAAPFTRKLVGWLIKVNPTGRMITRRVTVAEGKSVAVGAERSMGLAFSDSGLKMQGNAEGVTTHAGGTIEVNAHRMGVPVSKVQRILDETYSKHFYTGKSKKVGGKSIAAQLPGIGKHFLPEGKMSWDTFNEEVARAMNFDDVHAVPEVAEAARRIRVDYQDYLMQEAQRAHEHRMTIDGPEAAPLFTPWTPGKNPRAGTPTTHFNHAWDQEKIAKQGLGLEMDLEDHINGELNMILGERMAAHTKRVATFKKQLKDRPVMDTTVFKRELGSRKAELRGLQDAVQKAREEGGQGSSEQIAALTKDVERAKAEIDYLRADGTSMIHSASQRILDDLYGAIDEHTGAQIERKGGTDIGVHEGRADFSQVSKEIAQRLAGKIRGETLHLSGMEVLSGNRGVELSRMLNMDYAVKSKYLVTNIERIVRMGTRQLSSDIAIYKELGSSNGALQIAKIGSEYDQLIRDAAKAQATNPSRIGKVVRKLKGKKADSNDYVAQLRIQRDAAIADATTVVSRMRHQRRIPENVNSLLFRAAQMATDVGVTIMLGKVVISSFADLGRPMQKWGMMNTFRDGWAPFVANSPRYKMAKDQASLFNIGLDVETHSRTLGITDQYNMVGSARGPIGKTTHFMANKMGLVALFDHWTAWGKQMTASIVMGEISRGIRLLHTVPGATSEHAIYREMFASFGLTHGMQKRIWQQMTKLPEGGKQFGENWLPNTERWTDLDARDAYGAALVKAAEFDTIVTPGLDRPSWMDKNAAFGLLGMFHTFTASSFGKVTLAALQDSQHLDRRGMAVAVGTTFSVALGGLSYYASAMASGGKQWERAKNASLGDVTDEAILRSGQISWGADVLKGTEFLPHAPGHFGTVRPHQPTDMVMAALGPAASMAKNMAKIAAGLLDPTQSTVHAIRQMAAYNQVFYLSRLFTAVEHGANSLFNVPKSRKSK